MVREVTKRMPLRNREKIQAFMRGIIAAESNVEVNLGFYKYRVFITAVDDTERSIFQKCLQKLNIESKQHKYGQLIISKKKNNLELLNQELMSGSSEKYNKFLWMMKLYNNFEEYRDKKYIHDIPDWIVNEVLELHLENPFWPASRIMDELDGLVSVVQVNSVRRWLEERDRSLQQKASRKLYKGRPVSQPL